MIFEWPKSKSYPVYTSCVCNNDVPPLLQEYEYYIPESKYWNVKKKEVYCSPECSVKQYHIDINYETNK